MGKNSSDPFFRSSRGGYLAMEIARILETAEFGLYGKTAKVRFLGLYDPVDMTVYGSGHETISPNVRTAAVIYASGSSEEIGVGGNYELILGQLVLTEERSRWFFNRADHGPESANTDYHQIWLFGTHAAIGGAPWKGDMPIGHTETNDRIKAIESDTFQRNIAILVGVPINEVDDYGYQSLPDPEN